MSTPEYNKPLAEYAPLPPEFDWNSDSEYPDPAPEYTPVGRAAETAAPEKKRSRLKRMLYVVAAAAISLTMLGVGPFAGTTVRMPNLIGQTEERALSEVRARGLQVDVIRENDEAPAGIVFGQKPEPGETLRRGSRAELHISLGNGEESIPEPGTESRPEPGPEVSESESSPQESLPPEESGEDSSVPEESSGVPRTPVREIIAGNPNWYAEEYDIYLHFGDGYGWTFDGASFHRLLWEIENEGTEDEMLFCNVGYAYVIGNTQGALMQYRTAFNISEEDGLSAFMEAGVERDDGAYATFRPVDRIPGDYSLVESFGSKSFREILEGAGVFVPVASQGRVFDFRYMQFTGGRIHVESVPGVYHDLAMEYPYEIGTLANSEPDEFDIGNGSSILSSVSVLVVIKEDGLHLFTPPHVVSGPADNFYSEFIVGEMPPPLSTEADPADDEFPELSNLSPNGYVHFQDFGVLDEDFVILESADGSVYLHAGTVYGENRESTLSGARYDEATNTLTLTNFTGSLLNVNLMGNGFTLRLEGENHLDGILMWGFFYGGSLTITGTGSLTVNEGLSRDTGILFQSEYSETCLMIDSGVVLEVYGKESAILVQDTTMEKAIYFLKPLKINGGVRKGEAEEETSPEGETVYRYYLADEEGKPSKYVVFRSPER